ncbi:MAG TPA: hypothetical protein VGF84_14490 [Micromonosporaceae bacterium]|jgi:hypothetical protein
MSAWSVRVSADRFAAERLYHHEALELDGAPEFAAIQPGDRVALVADTRPPVVFALATAASSADGNADDPGADQGEESAGTLLLTYDQRFFDEPRPAPADGDGPVHVLAPADLAALVPAHRPTPMRSWLVSIDLPVEAETAAEAARRFWTYVRELGPSELPAFVRPNGDELAMQAFVLGDEANQDPEED